jgi:hypothetical protein
MTEIELAEFHSREAAKFSLDGLTVARARAYALLLVLLGGSAGLGSVALAQWGGPVAWAALTASVWWSAVATYLALLGLRSSAVRSWASTSVLLQYAEWCQYADEVEQEGQPRPDPLSLLRARLVDMTSRARDGYIDASNQASLVIDRVYIAMAMTPLVSLCAVVGIWLVR